MQVFKIDLPEKIWEALKESERFMRFNGIYSFDHDGRIRAIDLDEKAVNPLKKFDSLIDFKKVFYSKENLGREDHKVLFIGRDIKDFNAPIV